MHMRIYLTLALALIFIALNGCSSVDVSQHEFVRNLVGKCFEFTKESKLLKITGGDKKSAINLSAYEDQTTFYNTCSIHGLHKHS